MITETSGSEWVFMGHPSCGFPVSLTDTVGNYTSSSTALSCRGATVLKFQYVNRFWGYDKFLGMACREGSRTEQ